MEISDCRLDSRANPLPANRCPACKGLLDAATSLDDSDRPQPGDISVCFNCAAILEFDENMKLILASEEIMAGLPADATASIEHFCSLIKDRTMH